MSININTEEDLYNSLVKCKIKWTINNIIIDKKYNNNYYKLKIYLTNSDNPNFYFDKKDYSLAYYTNEIFLKDYTLNSELKKIEIWKSIDVIVNSEQDYSFLKNSNEDINNNLINNCIYNRNLLNNKENYNSQIYIFSWIILLLIIIIWILSFKFYKSKKQE